MRHKYISNKQICLITHYCRFSYYVYFRLNTVPFFNYLVDYFFCNLRLKKIRAYFEIFSKNRLKVLFKAQNLQRKILCKINFDLFENIELTGRKLTFLIIIYLDKTSKFSLNGFRSLKTIKLWISINFFIECISENAVFLTFVFRWNVNFPLIKYKIESSLV